MIRKETVYFMLFVIAVSAAIIVFYDRWETSNVCEFHREIFDAGFDSGVVKEKYIDRENHAAKTVIVTANNKDYELLFIPSDNWPDFDSIQINDPISKQPHSFLFSVDNEMTFELKYDCKFD